MAYQNIITPRFYINAYEFGKATGASFSKEAEQWMLDSGFDTLYDTIPSKGYRADEANYDAWDNPGWDNNQMLVNFPNNYSPLDNKYFTAFLGSEIGLYAEDTLSFDINSNLAEFTINADITTGKVFHDLEGQTNGGPGPQGIIGLFSPPQPGFTLIGWKNKAPTLWNSNVYSTWVIGSVINGSYYDMPYSTELKLTTKREMDGVKRIRTKGGNDLFDIPYTQSYFHSPFRPWGTANSPFNYSPNFNAPWDPVPQIEVEDNTWQKKWQEQNYMASSGKRSWNLKFSHMAAEELLGPNQSSSDYLNSFEGLNPSDYGGNTINLGWSGDIINISSPGGYDAVVPFTSTNTGYRGEHSNGHSTCYTPYSQLGLYNNIIYTLECDLEITYGIGPKVYIFAAGTIGNVSNLVRLEAPIGEITHQKIEFTFEYDISDSSPGSIYFAHNEEDENSLVELTNIKLERARAETFDSNIMTDSNFFSQVWHKTLGGTIPFIFQIDKNNNNPDQFAICKFENNSLKMTQVAPNVYDVSVDIKEVW